MLIDGRVEVNTYEDFQKKYNSFITFTGDLLTDTEEVMMLIEANILEVCNPSAVSLLRDWRQVIRTNRFTNIK